MSAQQERSVDRTIAEPVQAALAALEAKDLDGFLAQLTDDASIIDPHYPSPEMVGKPAIAEGMTWLFRTMDRLQFDVVDHFASPDGKRVALELVARHVGPGGREVEIPQNFLVDLAGQRLHRIRAYQPYGPGGAVGLILTVIRLWRRITARAASRSRTT